MSDIATVVFSLPEDTTTDNILIYSSVTEDGEFLHFDDIEYKYGGTTFTYDNIEDNKWYKIQFASSSSGKESPLSDPFFGGDFAGRGKPFATISTTFDGVNYASVTDIYTRASMTTDHIAAVDVQNIIRSTRAYLDLRLGNLNLNIYRNMYNNDVSRRKYNAQLRVLRECEINLTLSTIFHQMANKTNMDYLALLTTMADIDTIPDPGSIDYSGAEPTPGDIASVGIGGTSLTTAESALNSAKANGATTEYVIQNDNNVQEFRLKAERLNLRLAAMAQIIAMYSTQANNFTSTANDLFKSLMPATIDVRYGGRSSARGSWSQYRLDPLYMDFTINSYPTGGY